MTKALLWRVMLRLAVVEWLLLTATTSASYTKSYAGYVITLSGQDTYLSKDGAQTWCLQNGSKLLEIRSINVQTLVVQFLNDTGVDFADATLLFTGGVRNDFSGGWNWVNGRGTNSITVSGQGMDLANSFGYISVSPSRIYIVASMPTETRGYICQGKFDCTNGFILNELCHKIYTSPALTWFDARYRCSSDGGDLASFDFINDDRGFNSTLYGSWFSSSTTYWIGIRRQSWTWQTSNLEVNYTNWLNGRPVYHQENRCLCLYKSGSDWKWIECGCSNVFQFACMTEQSTTSSTSSSTTQRTITISTNKTTTLSGLISSVLYSTPTTTYSNSSRLESPMPTAITYVVREDNDSVSALAVGLGIGIPAVLIILAMGLVIVLMKRKLSYQTRPLASVTGDVDAKMHNQLDVRSNPRALEVTAEQSTSPYESLQLERTTTDDRHYQELRAARSS